MDKEHTAIARLQEAARTSEKFHKGKVERCCVYEAAESLFTWARQAAAERRSRPSQTPGFSHNTFYSRAANARLCGVGVRIALQSPEYGPNLCDKCTVPMEPRAFGIYQDENGEFVVCKDKSDGSRAIRRLRECRAEALLHLVALASDLLRKSAVGQGLYFVAQFHRQSSAEMQRRAVHRIADPREENCRLAYVKSPF